MITQRDLNLWPERQESARDSEQEAGARSLELRKRSNDLQKKTYTKWINSFLNKHGFHVDDLYTDLKDGKLLVRLLEVISGEKIEDRTRRGSRAGAKFYMLERIGKAFQFLHQKNIKLVGIQPADIQEGQVEQTLALIWAIILGFQFYQHAIPSSKTLAEEPESQYDDVQSSVTVAAMSSPTKGLVGAGVTSDAEKAEEVMEEQNVRGAMRALLHWCQKTTAGYHGVEVNNFTTSWIDGLAFNALIHKHRPELIDYELLWDQSPLDNLNNAFDVAEEHLNIPRLLDAEDVNPIPDKRSIVVYLSMYFLHLRDDKSDVHIEPKVQRVPSLVTVSQPVGASVPPSQSTLAAMKNGPLPPLPNEETAIQRKPLPGMTVSQTSTKPTELVVGNPNRPNVQQMSPPTATGRATSTGPRPVRPGEQPPPYSAAQQQYPHSQQYRYPQQPYPRQPYPQQPYPQQPYAQQQAYAGGYYQKPPPQQPVYAPRPYYPPPPMRQMQQLSGVRVQTGAGVLTIGSQQGAGSGGMMQSSSVIFK